MPRNYAKDKSEMRKTALERVEQLFNQAELKFRENSGLSNRYVQLAVKICQKAQIRMPSAYKKRYCRHCLSFLVPSLNCRVRVSKGNVIYHCAACNRIMKFGYLRERKVKKFL